MNDLAGTMRRISGLIAKAESTEFPEEATSLRAKAEELMARYRIEEEELISSSTAVTIAPVTRNVPLTTHQSQFRNEHVWLWAAIARHCGIRYHATYLVEDNEYVYVAMAVGYDIDIRLAEMLYSSARLVFGANLEPEVNPNETDAQNIYRLRSAGIDRQTIAERVFGRKGHAEGLKVGQLYREECARRGEAPKVTGRNVNAKTYREAYAQEFVTAFSSRLRVARDAADAAVGALVSVGRAERVEEAFYTLFPAYRPLPQPEVAEDKTAKPRKERGMTKADLARVNRMYFGPAAQLARGAARQAAEHVELGRPTPAKRTGSAPRAGELER
jgi:hypothetical protein